MFLYPFRQDSLSVHIPVMPYVLYVIVVFERFKQKPHLLYLILISKSGVCRGNLLCFCGNYGITHISQRICNIFNFLGIGCNLNTAVLKAEVISACFKNVFHSLIFVNGAFFVIMNDTQPLVPILPPNLSK